ncbi:MAG: hypothetical protein AABX32_00105 [Nanoarchaeota archaeon]
MKANLALKVNEVKMPAPAVAPLHIVKPQTESQVQPLNMSLDSMVMKGKEVPIRYTTEHPGYITYRYEGGQILMFNLDRKNPRDHYKIKELILTALMDYGNPNDFWEVYWKARGI